MVCKSATFFGLMGWPEGYFMGSSILIGGGILPRDKKLVCKLNSLPMDVSNEVAEGVSPRLAGRSAPSVLFRNRAFYKPIQILVLGIATTKLVEIIKYPFSVFQGHVGGAMALAAARKRNRSRLRPLGSPRHVL